MVREGAFGGSDGSEAVAVDCDPLRLASTEAALVLEGRKELSCGSVDSDV